MLSTDPIADMLSRIRNAILVNKNEISLPHSKIKESVARLLHESGYIDSVSVEKAAIGQTLNIVINQPHSNARISEIKRLSTPGRRMYSNHDNIPQIKQGRGLVIVSTSKGIMTGGEAKKQGIGGELICAVY